MPLNESDKIAHLLRRVGFAARPEEIERGVARGLRATVDELVNFDGVPDNLAPAPSDQYAAFDFMTSLSQWWLHAMMTTTRPLQEKMVLFWHGLFATSGHGVGDVRQMYLQNELFRGNFDPDNGQVTRPTPGNPYPVGNFRQMLLYLSKDPAICYWLDNRLNRRLNDEVGSNENYARELLELFSLGVEDVVARAPNYTEQDVRQASRALTGWSVRPADATHPGDYPRMFEFNTSQHDLGPYTVLGVTFRGGGDQLFDVIVRHRNRGQAQSACGRFLGYRLFKFFGYDDPEPEIINALADVFDGRNGEERYNIRNLLKTMFTPGNIVSEAFYSERAFKAHVKSPTEVAVSAFRLLRPAGFGEGSDGRVQLALRQMGQALFFPPDVSGWKEGLNWINTTFVLARYNFAHDLINNQTTETRIDVESIIRQQNLQTPEQIVDYFGRLLLQMPLSPSMRATFIQYLLSNTSGPFDPTHQRTIDSKIRGLIYLMMATAEFQLS
jgi:uncharacterized protein (DUF1800 family)